VAARRGRGGRVGAGDREVDGEDGEFDSDVRVGKRVLAADAGVARAVVKDRGTKEFVPPGESDATTGLRVRRLRPRRDRRQARIAHCRGKWTKLPLRAMAPKVEGCTRDDQSSRFPIVRLSRPGWVRVERSSSTVGP
jgi:hypothetical protein